MGEQLACSAGEEQSPPNSTCTLSVAGTLLKCTAVGEAREGPHALGLRVLTGTGRSGGHRLTTSAPNGRSGCEWDVVQCR